MSTIITQLRTSKRYAVMDNHIDSEQMCIHTVHSNTQIHTEHAFVAAQTTSGVSRTNFIKLL
jgi:hypothetical protein